jgi:hypothetical protein
MKRSQYVKTGRKVLPAWRNGELFARARWDREHPKRYTLLIRAALSNLKLRWWERVTVWNEYHQGANFEAAYQLLDFIVQLKGRGRFAILIHNPQSLYKPTEKLSYQAKQKLLHARGIPTLIIESKWSGNDIIAAIMIFIRRTFR